MKKIRALLAALMLLSGLAACGRQTVPHETPPENAPAAAGALQAENPHEEMITDNFINRYITSLDICLTGEKELVFDDPTLIPAQTLFMFFLYDLNANEKLIEGESDPGRRWYSALDGQYHIPVTEIEPVLSSCFERYNLSALTSGNDEVVVSTISGFGGDRNIEVTCREFLSQDTVRITVDFFGEDGGVYCTKIYTLRLREGGVTYLSILKSYEKSKSPVSVAGLKYGWLGYAQDAALHSIWTGYGNSTVLSPGEVLTADFRTFSRVKPIGKHRLTGEYFGRETYDFIQTIDALRLSAGEEVLWISGDYDPLPRPVEEVRDIPEEYAAEIAGRLTTGGAGKAGVNITDVLRADVDGDGTEETFIVANTARREDWEPSGGELLPYDTIAGGQGIYSIILMEKAGTFTEVYSEILSAGKHDHMDLYFRAGIAGLFDLDGDGNMEICLDTVHWDCPDIRILRYDGSKIEPVMTCGFAW